MILARSDIQWGDMAGWVSGAVTFAAVVVALVLAQRSRRDALRDVEARNIDETRRLLVILLAMTRDPGPEFLGTVAHAVAKHVELADLDTAFDAMYDLIGRRNDPTILSWINELDERAEAMT